MVTKPILIATGLLAPLRFSLSEENLVAVPAQRRTQMPNRAFLTVMRPGLDKEIVGTVEAVRSHSGAITYKVTRPRDDDYDTVELKRTDQVAEFLVRKIRKYKGTVRVTFDGAVSAGEAELRMLADALSSRIREFLADRRLSEVQVHLEGGF